MISNVGAGLGFKAQVTGQVNVRDLEVKENDCRLYYPKNPKEDVPPGDILVTKATENQPAQVIIVGRRDGGCVKGYYPLINNYSHDIPDKDFENVNYCINQHLKLQA